MVSCRWVSGRRGEKKTTTTAANTTTPPNPTKNQNQNNRPITNGILGCLDYDSDAEACTECLEPYFTLTDDGVCGESFPFPP